MSPLFYAVGASGHFQMTVQRYYLFFKCANKKCILYFFTWQKLAICTICFAVFATFTTTNKSFSNALFEN